MTAHQAATTPKLPGQKTAIEPWPLSIVVRNLDELAAFARDLAPLLDAGDVLFLHGPLGAGKTAFTQELARWLDVDDDQYVSSPSFALLHAYQGRLTIAHLDCYRLAGEEEVEQAGLAEWLEPEGIVIVEWPERLGRLAPDDRLDVHIDFITNGGRRLTLLARGDRWQRRLPLLTAFQPAADPPTG